MAEVISLIYSFALTKNITILLSFYIIYKYIYKKKDLKTLKQ